MRQIIRAKMKDNLIARYQLCRDLKGELLACGKMHGWDYAFYIKNFLKSIEGREVDLVFIGPDAFELKDNNVWLPNELWDAI